LEKKQNRRPGVVKSINQFFIQKTDFMAKKTNTDKGKPSGNKPAEGTGIPQVVNDK